MTAEIVEIVKPTSYDDIPRLQLPGVGGFPGPNVFIGNLDDVCDVVEAQGQMMYYVLALQEIKYTDEKNKAVTAKIPQIFKVLKSRSFRSCREDDNNILGLKQVKAVTNWLLPKMPWKLLDTVDSFFRAVHTKHGTEAIVILTYDSAFFDSENPSDGWGFVVPDQENTGSHCDYKPDSVADRLPTATTFTCGTIHSHPMMSAFASGTDHADQASEDGLHITFGWSRQTNMETEYHVELAAGKVNYSLNLSDVVETRPKLPVETDHLDEWLGRVSKATTTAISEVGYGGSWQGQGYRSSSPGGAYNPPAVRKPTDARNYPTGEHAPDLVKNLVIAVFDVTAKNLVKCPFCTIPMTWAERTSEHRCLMCKNYVAAPEEAATLDIILALPDSDPIRKAVEGSKTRDIFTWNPELGNSAQAFEKISDGVAQPMELVDPKA